MKAIALRRDAATPDVLVDRIMCHDVRDPHRRVVVPKGARIDAAAAATLLSVPWDEIHVLALDPGEEMTLFSDGPARVMLLGGAPLDGPRHIWWNFVSSSLDRIEAAKADWQQKRFAAVIGETERIPLPSE